MKPLAAAPDDGLDAMAQRIERAVAESPVARTTWMDVRDNATAIARVLLASETPQEGLDVALQKALIAWLDSDGFDRGSEERLLDAAIDWRDALAATPETKNDGRHRHVIEYPSACTGCEHLAASFVASAPEWMRDTPVRDALAATSETEEGT